MVARTLRRNRHIRATMSTRGTSRTNKSHFTGAPLMTRKVLLATATGLLAIAVACSKNSSNPTSPSAANGGTTNTVADGFLLKAGTPSPVSPTGNVQALVDPVTLTASTTRTTFVDVPLQYRFQVRSGSTVVAEAVVGPVSGSTVSFTPSGLTPNTSYTWRVQAT